MVLCMYTLFLITNTVKIAFALLLSLSFEILLTAALFRMVLFINSLFTTAGHGPLH